ncbi:uncharacterized protein LOC124314010 isoform X4 [Daphnia pulicaria]|uniref:uncharacterized protein LOC124314010 isoform X4 n=1 Tax=Daphnia pulicaria TaxID=35523 RepID=UPI001EEC95A3|nr:uncharacterized protein LOC124314010 isoform X4 [Daphnia pulicaria]
MAINIRAYSRDSDTSAGVGNAIIQQHHAPPGVLRGLPRDFGVGPPSHHQSASAGGQQQQPGSRGNRGNNRSDVSIQVDVGSTKATNSGGVGDRMGRTTKNQRGASGGGSKAETPPTTSQQQQYETALYSREDIREQYCINKKETDVLDRSSHVRQRAKGFFGCLTSRKDHGAKKKKSRSSFFSALCVRRASEENLYNGCNKPVANTNRSVTLPALQPFTVPLRDDGSNQPSLFRNRPQSFCTTDPRRFSMQTSTTPCIVNSYAPRHSDPDWKISTLPVHRTTSDVPHDSEISGSNHPFRYGGRLAYTQPNTPELSAALYRRQVMSSEALLDDRRSTGSMSKHVSFDASSPCSEIYTSAVPANASKSQERLLDGRKTPEPFLESKRHPHQTAAFSPVLARAILLERLRQASMRSQATQTEGYYNSTTSLSYPSCYSGAGSQVSIPGAASTVTRQVQTNFEPRKQTKRLTRSSSAVNQDAEAEGEAAAIKTEAEFQSLKRMPDELSQSQPEEIGDYKKISSPERGGGSPSKQRRSNRRRQLLKALSEGTILLDKKRARRFASGYVEVNVQDERSPVEEEIVAGRVLVHDPTRYLSGSGSSDDGSLNDDDLFASSLPAKPDMNRSLGFTDVEDVVWSDSEPHPHDGPPPHPAEEGKLLQAQKSFDSNASCPDTAGNYSDEFGSTSQVTVLQPHSSARQSGGGGTTSSDDKGSTSFVVTCDSDLDPPHPPTPPPRRPPAPTDPPSAELSETEKEIMVQFPPWPGSQDAQELIPAPPSFACSSLNSSQLPSADEEEDQIVTSSAPPLATAAIAPDIDPPSPNQQMSQRVLLRHLKNGSKSMSETITSVDSDSSGRRLTEHETSASSEPLSPPPSELNSPLQADVNNSGSKPAGLDSTDTNSDAFLTALSDHLTTAGLTEVYNTAMERGASERSYRESDTSHNSTLRMDHSGVQDLPYESPPPQDVLRDDDDDGAEAPVPIQPPLLTSPDSNNEGQEICRVESSTSGSYSLEATPCASLSPAPPLEMDSVKPFQAALDSELLSVPPIAPSPAHPEAAASTHPSAVAMATAADRKTLKETMKLQFPPGSSMFSNSASPSTPARSTSGATTTTGRRKHFTQQQSTTANQLSSTDSEQDNEEAGDRCTRKRRSNKNTSATAAGESAHGTTDSNKRPSSKHKKNTRHRDPLTPNNSFSMADGSVVRKRDSQIMSEVTTPGMVRSPAMHEGFRLADWDVVTPSLASAEAIEARSNYFTLQHPSEGSFHDPDNMADMVGTSWNLMAPTSTPQQNCDSIRSASPGSDNVFVSETTAELSGNGGVPPPPEGFADSPATLAPDWGLPSPSTKISSSIVGGPSDSTNGENLETTKRKRDSGRGKRTKSCTLPATSNFSVSGLSLEVGTGDRNEVLPHRAVSTIDMWYPETQLPPKRQLTVRAKSEERERFNRPARRNLNHLIRSVEASWDSLGSKLSVDGTPLDDEDAGIYNASYRAGAWAYIGETEELHVWRRSQPQTPLQETDDSSTASEKDFRRKYTSITHRMVHRKSSVEMFRRLATSTFDSSSKDLSVRNSLEDIYQLMLMIWCRESLALRRLADVGRPGECDDIVLVKRESGEFGFRIHGSRPVVVSAIEPGTPAELSGLQVGDILISINDVNVLDSSHSEVVRIAHIGTDELKLEVARTCNILSANPMLAPDQPTTTTTGECIQQGTANNEAPILVGYLWKKSQSASRADESANNVWYRRWFVLKRDHCLYYYKNQDSSQPLGAVSLLHYTVTRTSFTERPHGLLLSKGGTIRHWLAAESTESLELWHSVFNHASKAAVQQDVWLEMCARNIELPPASMASPDCVGHLMKLGHRAKEWQRRLCLLKDACLYFYVDINVSSALGALHLHGYRVQASGTTASSGERRKFAFELLPPEPRMRHFHFYTDSENDRKRWIAALEYSIDRWIRVG